MIQRDDYLSLGQARTILGVTREWLLKLRKAGAVPGAETVGGHPVFRKDVFIPWSKEYLKRPKRRLTKR